MSEEYWKLCVEEAFSEAGIEATDEQINTVAGVVEGGHEVFGEMTGLDVANKNFHQKEASDLETARSELAEEREKVRCEACKGIGSTTIAVGASHWSTDSCHECGGSGRI